MREFEIPEFDLNLGLKRFEDNLALVSGELDECFNLMPVEEGLEIHEKITTIYYGSNALYIFNYL